MTVTRSRPAIEVPRLPDAWTLATYNDMPVLANEIVERICSEIEEYRDDPTGTIAADAAESVTSALKVFMRILARGGQLGPTDVEVFRRLGRVEAEAGRSHDPLQAAYRIASQLVMRHLLEWERQFRAPRDVMTQLSSAIFGFIDQLATLSAEGFEQARLGGYEHRRARLRLLALLLQRGPCDRHELDELAAQCDWLPPARCRIVEVTRPAAMDDGALAELAVDLFGPAALAGRVSGRAVVLTPEQVELDRLRTHAQRVDPRMSLFVGPAVELAQAAESGQLAGRAAVSVRADGPLDGGVVLAEEHLLTLLEGQARGVVDAMAGRWLAPLAGLSPAKRVKYGRLLSAWLELGSSRADAPGVLDKHRQTLRYQLGQLESMFGTALQDRDARLEIMLALRRVLPEWERAATGAVPPVTAPATRVRANR